MIKNKKKVLTLLLLSLTILTAAINAGDFEKIFGLPPFAFQINQYPSDEAGRSKVEVHVGLVNDLLQFVQKDDRNYSAGFELSLNLVDSTGASTKEYIQEHRISADSFEETNSTKAYNSLSIVFHATPGKAVLHLDIMDLETRKHLQRKWPLEIRAFKADKLELSSVAFLNMDGSINLPRIYAEPEDSIALSFIVGGAAQSEPYELKFELKDWNNNIIQTWKQLKTGTGSNEKINENLASHIKGSGNYTLVLTCSQNDVISKSTGNFMVKSHQATDVSDIDEDSIVGALKYITDSATHKKILQASGVERKRLLAAFWKQRDITAETPENELEEEFIRRTRFANKHFSVLSLKQQGWKLDRGRYYIQLGPPTWIQPQSNKFGAVSLETWYYKESDIRLVFRDKKGSGNFKLVHKE